MLTIRQPQIDAFARAELEDFTRRLVVHLSELARTRGAIPVDTAGIDEQVRRGVASGVRFFRTEKDLARYCEIVLTRLGGWQEKDHPSAVLELLRPPSIAAERRLDNFELWIRMKRKRT